MPCGEGGRAGSGGGGIDCAPLILWRGGVLASFGVVGGLRGIGRGLGAIGIR